MYCCTSEVSNSASPGSSGKHKEIVTRTACESIVSNAACEGIVPSTAPEQVVTTQPFQFVIATLTVDDIIRVVKALSVEICCSSNNALTFSRPAGLLTSIPAGFLMVCKS